jgi:hypothetical protein
MRGTEKRLAAEVSAWLRREIVVAQRLLTTSADARVLPGLLACWQVQLLPPAQADR